LSVPVAVFHILAIIDESQSELLAEGPVPRQLRLHVAIE
jgi:hypothetical protein